MPGPVTFECQTTIALTGQQISEQILDLSRWPEFSGYGPLPGIKSAEFAERTADVVGTRIQVQNNDGSRHVEQITEWDPERTLCLQFGDFTPPLSVLADKFVERWEFQAVGTQTDVTRSFELHARSWLFRPIFQIVALFLRRAIARHLNAMRDEAQNDS